MPYPNTDSTKRRKSTGIRWWTTPGGQQFVGVNGFSYRVLSNTDTDSGIKDRSSQPILWPSIRTLDFVDETGLPRRVYGCADCGYAAQKHGQVRPHRNAHRLPKTGGVPAEIVTNLKDLIRRADAADRVAADRDDWKRRALTAERRLSALRQAVGKVMDS